MGVGEEGVTLVSLAFLRPGLSFACTPDDISKLAYTLRALAQDPCVEAPTLDADTDAALRWMAERSDAEVVSVCCVAINLAWRSACRSWRSVKRLSSKLNAMQRSSGALFGFAC